MHPTSLRLGQHTATQRGVTLLEILLATGLFAAALVLIFSIITDQQRDAQNKIVAANMKDVLEASQTYVQANWDELLVDLADSAALGGVAVLEFDVGDLVTEGYLGAAFLNNAAGDNAQNLFEQEYRVLARGVDIADTANPQDTVTTDFADTELKGRGRHDACVLPRAVPMVEAMAALVLVDHMLRQRALCGQSEGGRG